MLLWPEQRYSRLRIVANTSTLRGIFSAASVSQHEGQLSLWTQASTASPFVYFCWTALNLGQQSALLGECQNDYLAILLPRQMALDGRPTHGCYEGMSHIFQDSQDDQDLIDFVTLDVLGCRGYEYPIDFHLSSPEFQSDVSTAVTNVDLNEFQNLVKPNLDDPWTYGQPRNQQALPSFTITDVSSRANTVAGDPKAEYNFLRRPALQQRLSQDSRVDSAFSEIHSISEAPELSPIYLSEEALGPSYGHVPRPTPSVRSAQTAPSGKKRKGTKEIAIPCRRPHCTKVSKNRSDAEYVSYDLWT